MYLTHFGVREFPFTLTPDTAFFLNRSGYQDALNVLLVALRSGEGFVKVVGEVGTGKTLLCRKLLNSIGPDFVTAYIHNPYLHPDALLRAIADELVVEHSDEHGQHDLVKRLTARLMALHEQGFRVALCLDEVQAMPVETLETLRLLTNLETEKRKLLQVVLFGQPELDELLDECSVRQLKQRITFSYRLAPMDRTALDTYIAHRLVIAGYQGEHLFSRGALNLIFHASGGIPRLVNVLCHKSMLLAFGKGRPRIDRSLVRAAVNDTASSDKTAGFWACVCSPLRWLSGATAMVLGLGAALNMLVDFGLTH